MSVLVRSAVVADAGQVAQIHVDAWRAAYAKILPQRILDGLSVAGRETQWRARLAPTNRGPRPLVAEIDGEVGGFATYSVPSRDFEEAADVGEIPALYVSPTAWRSGLGSALIEAAATRMADAGCSEGILWMLQGNDAARFYESSGWHDDGGRRPSQYFPSEARLVEVRFRRSL